MCLMVGVHLDVLVFTCSFIFLYSTYYIVDKIYVYVILNALIIIIIIMLLFRTEVHQETILYILSMQLNIKTYSAFRKKNRKW